MIAVAFVILSLFASSMYNYYTNIVSESQKAEARAVSERIGDKILTMYSRYEKSGIEPQPGENITLGTSTLDTPEGIGGRNYRIYLNSSGSYWITADLESSSNISITDTETNSARIVIKTIGFPEETYEYPLYNIDLNLTGSAERPNEVSLNYVRRKEGSNITDIVRMKRAS